MKTEIKNDIFSGIGIALVFLSLVVAYYRISNISIVLDVIVTVAGLILLCIGLLGYKKEKNGENKSNGSRTGYSYTG